MRADVRASVYERRCFCCGKPVAEGEGIGFIRFGILVCQGDCTALVEQEAHDHTRSRRGRQRSRAEVLRRLRALRTLRQALAELAPRGSCP